jgi:hypothetical protein
VVRYRDDWDQLGGIGGAQARTLSPIVFPAIAGSEKRLFGDAAIPRGLSPSSIATTARGVVIQVYDRTGDLITAEFGPAIEDAYPSHS